MIDNNRRIRCLDFARTIAIMCVVLCHSVEAIYSDTDYFNLSNISQISRIILFTIGRLGVPIFLFLTGILILKKEINEDKDICKFYKNNLIPLFITVEIWNIIYNIFLALMSKNFSIGIVLQNILFFKQVDMNNMWYMIMILGIYIALPFIAKLVKISSIKTIKIPMFVIFISSIVLPSINVVLHLFGFDGYNIILDLSFLGGTYGLYILTRILYD